MRVVLDTNVIIDAVASRQPFCEAAESILLMVSQEQISGYVTANSITDIYYVVRRILPEAESKEIIRSLLYSLEVIEVGNADCWEALSLQIGDFEDALVAACAQKIGADYIISRDENFAKADSPVKVIYPTAFLSR